MRTSFTDSMRILLGTSDRGESAFRLSRADRVVEGTLIGLLAFMPWTFGVVDAWSTQVVMAGGAILASCLAVNRLSRPGAGPRGRWLWGPVLLFLALVTFHLLPLPRGVLGFLSPQTIELRAEALAGLPETVARPATATLSLYPFATRHHLYIVCFATIIFAAVADSYRMLRQVRRLLLAVATVGLLNVLLALLQYSSGTNAVYWAVPVQTGRPHGTFVNYSNFAQFVNLSMGAAFALLLPLAAGPRGASDEGRSPRRGRGYASLGSASWKAQAALSGAIVAGLVAIFLSTSRAGMIASLAALAVVIVGLTTQPRFARGRFLVAGIGMTAFAALVYGGFDLAYDRLSTLATQEDPSGGRLQVNADILRIAQRFPLFGTGLGTHEVVFPQFNRASWTSLSENADSDYFQALEETGTVGLALVLAFAAGVVATAINVIRNADAAPALMAVGLLAGLVAVLIQSVTDFGQHLPAIAGLSATTCGLFVALSRLPSRNVTSPVPTSPPYGAVALTSHAARLRGIGAATLAVMLVVSMVVGVIDFDRRRRASDAWEQARRAATELERAKWKGSDDQFVELLTASTAALALVPEDVFFHFWTNYYRWQAIAQQTGAAREFAPELRAFAAQVADALHQARPRCPTFGQLPGLAGQIEAFVLGRPSGSGSIHLGRRLSPNDPSLAYAAGLAFFEAGDADRAVAALGDAVKLSPNVFPEAAAALIGRGRLLDALKLAEGVPTRLVHIYSQVTKSGFAPEGSANRVALDEALRRSLAETLPAASTARELAASAEIARMQHDEERSVELLAKALERDYGDPRLHLEHARSLRRLGRINEALRSARLAAQLSPGDSAPRRLLEELSELDRR